MTGNAPFFPTFVAAAVLVGLHWLFAALAVRLDLISPIVKGRRRPLIEEGEILWDQMRRSDIGERDLYEGMRSSANTEDLAEIEAAYQERNGQISFIKKKSEPAILDITVADGVQTVRIQLG